MRTKSFWLSLYLTASFIVGVALIYLSIVAIIEIHDINKDDPIPAPIPTVTVTQKTKVPGPTKTAFVSKYDRCPESVMTDGRNGTLADLTLVNDNGGCVWRP